MFIKNQSSKKDFIYVNRFENIQIIPMLLIKIIITYIKFLEIQIYKLVFDKMFYKY